MTDKYGDAVRHLKEVQNDMSKGEQLYYKFAQEVSPLAFLPWSELPEHVQNAWQHIYELAVELEKGDVIITTDH